MRKAIALAVVAAGAALAVAAQYAIVLDWVP
jgi:hypothetical protein